MKSRIIVLICSLMLAGFLYGTSTTGCTGDSGPGADTDIVEPCGDGTCDVEAGETLESCPADCTPDIILPGDGDGDSDGDGDGDGDAAECGDGVCTHEETVISCEQDCTRLSENWSAITNIDHSGDKNTHLPDVGIDTVGNIYTIWAEEEVPRRWGLRSNLYNAATNQWRDVDLLVESSDLSVSLTYGNPVLKVRPQGGAIATWLQEYQPPGMPFSHRAAFSNFLEHVGTDWDPAISLTDTFSFKSFPAVAYADTEDHIAAFMWAESADAHNYIMGKVMRDIENISGDFPLAESPTLPSIAMYCTSPIAVWAQNSRIYYSSYAGDAWSDPILYSADEDLNVSKPSITANCMRRLYSIIWRQDDELEGVVLKRIYIHLTGLEAPIILENAHNNTVPQVAIDNTGIVMISYINTDREVRAYLYNVSSGTGELFDISGSYTEAGVTATMQSKLAMNNNGDAVVVWLEAIPEVGGYKLMLNRFNKTTGVWLVEPEILDVRTETSSPSEPNVAINAGGNIVVTWVKDGNVKTRIYTNP